MKFPTAITCSTTSRCPTCNKYVDVLSADRGPVYFICWTDRLIFEAGHPGPVVRT